MERLIMSNGCGILGSEDSRSRFNLIEKGGGGRGATPLAGDEMFLNSLGDSVCMSLFGIFQSGQSRDAAALTSGAINTDSRDCPSLLNTSNSQSGSNSGIQILPPTAGQVSGIENEASQLRPLFPSDSVSQAATGDTQSLNVVSSKKKGPEKGAAEAIVASNNKDSGKTARASPEGERRLQGTWSAEENNSFFLALRLHGRCFDKIHDDMGATKTREQVRCYYYRVIKKINQIISFTNTKIDKGSNSEGNGVIDAILCWWDLMKKGTMEDTSVNLFRNSANLSDDERMIFARKLWSKSATKTAIPFPEYLTEPEKKVAQPVAQRIDFDPSGHAARREEGGTAHTKAWSKMDASVKIENGKSLSVHDRTPKREGGAKGGSLHTSPAATAHLVGETPLRDERLVIQSPKGNSQSENSLEASPNALSPLSLHLPGHEDGSVPTKLKLRLIARSADLRHVITMCGFNPQLELTFKPTKAIGSIAAHLKEKWGANLMKELVKDESNPLTAACRKEGGLDCTFRLFIAKDGDHPGWGPEDKSVHAKQVYWFMGHPSRFQLYYSLEGYGSHRKDRSGASGSPPLEPDSSSCSNDFIPFQRHLSRTERSAAGDAPPVSLKMSPSRSRHGASCLDFTTRGHTIDFAEVANRSTKNATPAASGPTTWTEDEVLFSSMLASRDGMGYTHSNMGGLSFPGDSLDGLHVLLNPDESSLGAALGAGSCSRLPPMITPSLVAAASQPQQDASEGAEKAPAGTQLEPILEALTGKADVVMALELTEDTFRETQAKVDVADAAESTASKVKTEIATGVKKQVETDVPAKDVCAHVPAEITAEAKDVKSMKVVKVKEEAKELNPKTEAMAESTEEAATGKTEVKAEVKEEVKVEALAGKGAENIAESMEEPAAENSKATAEVTACKRAEVVEKEVAEKESMEKQLKVEKKTEKENEGMQKEVTDKEVVRREGTEKRSADPSERATGESESPSKRVKKEPA